MEPTKAPLKTQIQPIPNKYANYLKQKKSSKQGRSHHNTVLIECEILRNCLIVFFGEFIDIRRVVPGYLLSEIFTAFWKLLKNVSHAL